jgi:hypothetical protein
MRDNEVGAMQEPKGHGQKVLGLMIHYLHLSKSHEIFDTMDFALLCFALCSFRV